MKRARATLGTLLFFVAAPAVVAGLVPWWISGWPLEGRDSSRSTG